jgi:hypothetical protein
MLQLIGEAREHRAFGRRLWIVGYLIAVPDRVNRWQVFWGASAYAK